MILVVTPNPAIDRTIILPRLMPGSIHRAEQVLVAAGGKGLNVVRAIKSLGGTSLSLGFAGGHSGRLLADLARNDGLNASWTRVDSETRTCTLLISQGGVATVVNEPGMPVSKSDWEQLQAEVRKYISAASLVCVCGSLPPGSSDEDLRALLNILVETGKPVWVDTSGSALDTAIACPGICIKVNSDEISTVLGVKIKDASSAKRALSMLVERGVTASVITLGAGGALLATSDGRWHAQAPVVSVVSTVGSGDSFLGGLVNALDGGKGWPEALRDAAAAGTANALSIGGGRFTSQEFNNIRDQVQIRTW